jgi:hypothetical protein
LGLRRLAFGDQNREKFVVHDDVGQKQQDRGGKFFQVHEYTSTVEAVCLNTVKQENGQRDKCLMGL